MKPVPFNMIFFKIIINHLGGINADNHCKICGIFSMGKINPEGKVVGNISESIEMNIAIC